MRAPRSSRALRSPRTQRMASTRLLLPEPLGPTTAVMPGSKSSCVFFAKVLNPWTSTDFRCTLRHPRARAYPPGAQRSETIAAIMALRSAAGQYAGSFAVRNTTSCISRLSTEAGARYLEGGDSLAGGGLLRRSAGAPPPFAKAHPREAHLDVVVAIVAGTGGLDYAV